MHGKMIHAACTLSSLMMLLGACAAPLADDDLDEEALQSGQGLSQAVSVGTQLKTTDTINFRSGPGFGFSKLGLLPKGAIVEVVQSAPKNDFYNVRYEGTTGWAHGDYLRRTSTPAPPPTNPPPTDPPPTNPPPTNPPPTNPPGTGTGGSGGALTDSTFLSFSDGKYTSQYHLYAAGLDWSKPVGLIVYGDGSGEYGLKNPKATYLLAGTNGLVNVAKRNNMVLLTPFSPNKSCSDGDGSCWYLGDPTGYASWSAALVKDVESRYDIAKNRVALGGYSSGAQWLTEYFAPGGHADDIMTDGVAVAISYGGSPKVTASFAAAFKANVHFNWNTGSQDSAYTGGGAYGVKAGYDWYSKNGFATSLDVISGLGHSRSDFGAVMEAQIKEHIPAAR